MTEIDELRSSISSLHEKVDRALALLDGMSLPKPAATKQTKPKPLPLTEDETAELQSRFNDLFEQWENGQELETRQSLEQLDADRLRRLADANNLNVTSKMSKEKVLQLISFRFREKKQLLKPKGFREG